MTFLSEFEPVTLHLVGTLLWGAFLLSWFAAAAWTSPAIRRSSRLSRARDAFFYLVSFTLLFTPRIWIPGLWDVPVVLGCILLALELLSFAFAWWARRHLGELWSGWITLRTGHRVIETGPYRLVRHPVYTGFIGAAWALALLTASPTALLGAALLSGHMASKAKREERFLRAELGAAQYDSYAAKTPMLLPTLKRHARH